MMKALAGLLLLLAAPAEAAPLSVYVRLAKTSAALREPVPVTITLTSVNPEVASARQPDVMTVTVPGKATLDLPPGVWKATAAATPFLSEEQMISLPPNGTSVGMELWVKARVEGELKSGEPLPATFSVRWQKPGDRTSGASECRVTKRKFGCDVPAGTFDYRFRAVGFLTQYRWATEVKPGITRNIGVLQLARGASVVGWALPGRGVTLKKDEPVEVALSPVDYGRTQEDPSAELVVRPNDKGFFQLAGVAPGEYFIRAGNRKLFSDQRRILVRQNMETELNDPFLLAPPGKLRIAVTPPLDPTMGRWRAAVKRSTSGGSNYSVLTHENAGENGRIEWAFLLPGEYVVEIESHDGRRYLRKEIDVAAGDFDLSVDVPLTRVHGTVTLGGKPLQSTVWVGGRKNDITVDVKTDEEGNYSAVAPFSVDEDWYLTVESSKPPITRTVTRRPQREDEASVRLDVELGAGGIEGTVVDEKGVPVKRAILDINSPNVTEGLIQTSVDETGKFSLHGMAPGSYSVQARGFDTTQSDMKTVVLADETDVQFVTIVLKPQRTFHGRVMSPAGPVAGARVIGYPVGVFEVLHTTFMTDAGGNFTIDLPAATRLVDVSVSPPGFAQRIFRIELRDESLTINVGQNNGTVQVITPNFNEDAQTPQGFLLHEGAALPILHFYGARDVRTTPKDKDHIEVSIPMMDPGVYSFCIGSYSQWFAAMPFNASQCTSAVLSPYGTLRLDGAKDAKADGRAVAAE
ncbi:MAG: carboxypeptidase regulatory-like domain-containing protein [Acidobacteria bacterium]|nr:carboxypeptidase regulatory-like domain-containing protein [Acidobacteriota bacterium]